MSKKYAYMWFDGDVRRRYFSSKVTFNKWLNEFVDELLSTGGTIEDYYNYDLVKLKKSKAPKKEIKKHYSSPLFLEKIELDIP